MDGRKGTLVQKQLMKRRVWGVEGREEGNDGILEDRNNGMKKKEGWKGKKE